MRIRRVSYKQQFTKVRIRSRSNWHPGFITTGQVKRSIIHFLLVNLRSYFARRITRRVKTHVIRFYASTSRRLRQVSISKTRNTFFFLRRDFYKRKSRSKFIKKR